MKIKMDVQDKKAKNRSNLYDQYKRVTRKLWYRRFELHILKGDQKSDFIIDYVTKDEQKRN